MRENYWKQLLGLNCDGHALRGWINHNNANRCVSKFINVRLTFPTSIFSPASPFLNCLCRLWLRYPTQTSELLTGFASSQLPLSPLTAVPYPNKWVCSQAIVWRMHWHYPTACWIFMEEFKCYCLAMVAVSSLSLFFGRVVVVVALFLFWGWLASKYMYVNMLQCMLCYSHNASLYPGV